MKFNSILLFFLVLTLLGCKGNKSLTSDQKPLSPDEAEITEREEIRFQEIFFAATKEKMLGNKEAASEQFQKALQINPNSATIWFELALIRESQQNYSEALQFAEKAVELDPKNKWYLLLLADYYKKTRNYDDASKIYEKLIGINPEAIENYYELASVYIMQNNLKKAISVYDGLEKKYGVTEDVNIQKHKIYLELKDPESAIVELEKLIKAYPSQTQYYGLLAELYLNNNQPDEALKAYQKIKEIDPNNPYVQLSMAEYYERAGNKEEARKSLKEAFANPSLDIDSKIKILLNFYNNTETETENIDFAFELNKINIETHPEDPKGFAMYADYLYRKGDLKEAKEMYQKVLSFDKGRYLVWNQLLMINSEEDDYKSMAQNSKEAMELFPNLPSFYFFNGVAYYQMKDYQKAINAFETGKEFVFDNPILQMQFYSNLGDAYYGVQKHKQAFDYYQKALDLDPNNAYILNNYSYYLSELEEDLEKAEKMSKKSNELAPNTPSYLDTYAWILFKMKNYTEAKKYLEKAFESGGKNNAVLLSHYGDILYQLGDIENAKLNWKNAFEKDNSVEGLKEKIERGTLYEE